MDQFKVGDVVELKSGGPKMTVEDVTSWQGKAKCVWFEGAQAKEEIFEVATLRISRGT
jgi:uncharacterized protein YodC (DUF2158 family)